ncbi:uncharacterized protein LOC124200486 [Daphnia pulex]|uniref:uncharacterized protein LOC124200486 n=1 Tax=Daphnia pulex TaxID=6669 RepID=UPI001EE02A7E|nr:uncharacterized protein LOC124200486 [Daphnia pulex]
MKIPNIKRFLMTMALLFTFFVILNLFYSFGNEDQSERLELSRFTRTVKNHDRNLLSSKFVVNRGMRDKGSSKFRQIRTNSKENTYFDGLVFAIENVIDWKKTNMQTLTSTQIMDYLLWTNQSSCRIAQYFGGVMVSSATGLVSLEGQKALCLDYAVKPIGTMFGIPGRCLVYSFGINHEWSFDEAMELYGCEIFSFDPSMNVSTHNRTNNIHFYRMALGSVDNDGWEKSPSVPTRTLSSIYDMLKPIHGYESIIDYLKIDIETSEWHVLPHILNSGMMDKVRQLAVEIHVDFNKSITIFRQQASLIQSLEKYGLVRFDSKPNINTLVHVTDQINNLSLFNGYEVAWYNNRLLRKTV